MTENVLTEEERDLIVYTQAVLREWGPRPAKARLEDDISAAFRLATTAINSMPGIFAIIDRLVQRLRDLEQERQAVESSGGYAVIDDLKKRLRDSEARVRELERMVNDSEANLMAEATARRTAKREGLLRAVEIFELGKLESKEFCLGIIRAEAGRSNR